MNILRNLDATCITSQTWRVTSRHWIWSHRHPITGCAVAQHCYNGDVRFLWENFEIWPVKFKPLDRLPQNLSQLITSTGRTFVPNLVKIRSRGTSGQIGEMSLSCDFFIFFLRHAKRSNPLTDFDTLWLKMRGITQGCAFLGLKYLMWCWMAGKTTIKIKRQFYC